MAATEGYDDFETYAGPAPRLGWLLNMAPTTFQRGDRELSGVELFLLSKDAKNNFRVTVGYAPYFYVAVSLKFERLTEATKTLLQRRFEQENCRVETVLLEDLDAPNHVAGYKRPYLKLSFDNVRELMSVRQELKPVIFENRKRLAQNHFQDEDQRAPDDLLEALDEIREYDVPYAMRCSIDLDFRVGAWLEVQPDFSVERDENEATDSEVPGGYSVTWQRDVLEKSSPRILAFDIECTKAPLKFPNAERDAVFMISYMIDGQGYLVISRDVVSEDIPSFEYTPKPAFPGPFTVFNEQNEEQCIRKFIEHCKELKPHVFVTYNGDFFDWPFLDKRCQLLGISIANELGIAGNEQGEWRGTGGQVHLDAFAWVKRDSYLPQGSQGLKAVTKYKLGYDPVEVDPEDMVRFARTEPRTMASYSVSDAVATFYLYEIYVNLFIFSLCTVIPNGPEDVLRKGSGTLCEALLMVEAFKAQVVCPNKQNEHHLLRKEGKLVESETYVGGHVESLESGVFRSDLPVAFDLDSKAFEKLIENVDRDLEFHARTEGKGASREDVANFDEVRGQLIQALEALRDAPKRTEAPRIYHLDVSAMYPNIILTNRLQPTAIVDREKCAGCDYNREGNQCKRPMDWIWRGDVNPSSAAEVNSLHRQLQYESVDVDGAQQRYAALPEKDQALRLKTRLRDYAQKVYQKQKVVIEEPRTDVVCMRENSFYVDTVRAFRDRRYEYKGLTKAWKKKREKATDRASRKHAEDKELLFESLQVAHKCILNSFYGYVMRKGARWRSMPMAGIVTLTGAQLITQARELVEKVGRPLELDTDGIWCMLPESFPENYVLDIKQADGSVKKLPFSYPCGMLNADVHANYTNHQMQTKNGEGGYDISSECSIFFEVDGPYKCMVLPASTEEGKLLKKRYAVFNDDGSLAELKGFELKRRGELELIKAFQAELFDQFLRGNTIEECYAQVASCANAWLDIVEHRGAGMDADEVLDLISENRSLSREVSEYEGRKMTSLTTARRIADFLGDDMIQGSGLQCKLVISAKPAGAPVTERAIPTVIFSAEPAVRRHFLRKWLKDPAALDPTVSDVVDWRYYRDRLEGVIRKIVTIPAALQGVANPVPRVPHPEWLRKFVANRDDTRKQTKISAFFDKENATSSVKKPKVRDLEDIGSQKSMTPVVARSRKKVPKASTALVPSSDAPQLGLSLKKIEPSNYEAWLQDRKQRWRARRAARKVDNDSAKKMARHATTVQQPLKRKTVTDLVRSSTRSLTRGTWRVLEVRDGDTPGLLTCFVVTDDGLLQRASVKVDRRFYVDVDESQTSLKDALQEFGARKVPRATPPTGDRPGSDIKQIYEVRVDESRENNLADLLPRLGAKYEYHTPAWFRQVCAGGGACRVRRSAAKELELKGGALVFEPDDLELAPSDASDSIALLPLSGDRATRLVRVAYLYHGKCPKTGRACVALFYLDRRERGEEESTDDALSPVLASLIVADPKARKGDRPPAMKRLFEMATADSQRPWKELRVEKSETKATEAEALTSAGASLAQYASEKRGPTLVIVESSMGAAELRRTLPQLGDFANCEVPYRSDDSRYPRLGWQSWVCRRVCERASRIPRWLVERQRMARYANVPLSSLGQSPLTSSADVLMARSLKQHRHLLWASSTGKPDLGDMEEEASFDDDGELPLVFRDFAPLGSSYAKRTGGTFQDVASTSATGIVECPGAYRTVCARVDVFGSAVNAVMVSDDLAGDSALGEAGYQDQDCAHAFRILRALLAEWVDDVSKRRSEHADALLVNVERWLRDRSSILHHPSLRRLVQSTTKRVRTRLVSDLRRLGLRVVHAGENEVILATRETDPKLAAAHLEFVSQTISQRPVFRYLHLKPRAFYASLLYLNAHNFGAIELLDQDEDMTTNEEGEERLPVQDRFVSQWDLAIELPPVAVDWFNVLVGAFLHKPLKARTGNLQQDEAFTQQFVETFSSQKLMPVISELQRDYHGTSTALDFVILSCRALALDPSVEEECVRARRLLLAQLGVREFDPKAQIKKPPLKIEIKGVACPHCDASVDVDVAAAFHRGRAEEAHQGIVADEDAEPPQCLCDRCGAALPSSVLEQRVAETITLCRARFLAQDLRCKRCKRVCREESATHCPCSGTYDTDVNTQEFYAYLNECHDAAGYFKFETLGETCLALVDECKADVKRRLGGPYHVA